MSLDHLPKTIRHLLKKSIAIRRIERKKVKRNQGDEFVFMMQEITGEKGDVFPVRHWEAIEWLETDEDDVHMCLCTHPIHKICRIKYSPTGDVYEVGIDCVEKIDISLYEDMVRLKKGPKAPTKEEILQQLRTYSYYEPKNQTKKELIRKLELYKNREEERIKLKKELEEKWEQERPEREAKEKKERLEREAKEKEEQRIFQEICEVKKLKLDWKGKWTSACKILGYKYVCKGSDEYEKVKRIFEQL